MGLDMYLRAHKYASAYEFSPEEDKRLVALVTQATGITPVEHTPSVMIDVTVAYWRKANHVHQWFVENCQGGRDECQEAYVGKEQLAALYTLCEEILEDPSKGPGLLPTQSGFFFGSTEYDEDYLNDVRDTRDQLKRIFDDPALRDSSIDFIYQSSW